MERKRLRLLFLRKDKFGIASGAQKEEIVIAFSWNMSGLNFLKRCACLLRKREYRLFKKALIRQHLQKKKLFINSTRLLRNFITFFSPNMRLVKKHCSI